MTEFVEYLQKPSKKSSIDVSHILSKEFGSLYTFDCLEPEIIENLKITQGSTDENHQKFVSDLVEITTERDNLFNRTKALHDHINDALLKSFEDDKSKEIENQEYLYLNLPKEESTFFNYVDDELLRQNGLIAPSDILLNITPKKEIPCLDNLTIVDNDEVIFREPTDEKKLPPITIMNKEKKRRQVPYLVLASEREENRFQLDLLNSKTNYLKNPRFLTNNKEKKKLTTNLSLINNPNCEKKLTELFISDPEIIEFKDYEIGKVFEKSINFSNITRVMQHIRVLPPKTRHFSLGLGQFPGPQGLVAAGMSCQYLVRFSPDSVGDYKDELVVETQAGNQQNIQIIAQRERPNLSGSKIWNMGYCLIYGMKVVHYRIKNTGGSGKFWIIPQEQWPSSNYKTLFGSNNNQIQMDPFIIRPTNFELKKNESTTIELIFYPTILKEIEKKLVIICDNGHLETYTIKGIGELASISLVEVQDGFSIPAIDEATDISAEILIKFENLNPFTYYQKVITIKNNCHIEIPFCWRIIKPYLEIKFTNNSLLEKDDDNSNLKNKESDNVNIKSRILDMDSAFMVDPNIGVFKPMETLQFVVTFAPMDVKKHHSVLHLILQGIPDLVEPDMSILSSNQNNRPIGFDESVLESKSSSSIGPALSKQQMVALIEITCLEIETKGECIPLAVRLSNPTLLVGGSLLINTPVRRQIEIINESMRSVNIGWFSSKDIKQIDSPSPINTDQNHIFEVEPKYDIIAPGTTTIDVCLVSSKPGFVRDSLWCHVENLESPLQLIVEVNFHGPQLELSNQNGSGSHIDFGLVRVGQLKSNLICLSNNSATSCKWNTRLCDSTGDLKLLEEIMIEPKSGELKPLENLELNITLCSFDVKDVNCEIEIAVEYGNSRSVNVSARIQRPEVILSQTVLDITNEQFIAIPTTYEVTLKNLSLLETTFFWDPVTGEDASIVSVIYEPRSGVLNVKEEVKIKITVTCHKKKYYSDLFLPCKIVDMVHPLVMEIKGNCFGPNLIYSIINDDSELDELENEINFGDNISIFQDITRYIIIENTTSIPTKFDLSLNHFMSTNHETIDEIIPNNNSTSTILKKRPNLADRQSKPDYLAHYDYCKSHLKSKLGFGICFKPQHGLLKGYQSIKIGVSAYNDMWGLYRDVITINGITELKESTDALKIPIKAHIHGIPLEFTMNAGRKDHQPVLRLGSKPIGHELISRQVRINNKSPCDIFINWEMYKEDLDNDKLIDLIINVGDPFPVPDEPVPKWPKITTNRSTERETITDGPLTTSERQDYSDSSISIVTRPYEGQQSIHPISFNPSQLHIASESYEFVTVTFDPSVTIETNAFIWDTNNGVDFNNYLLGYLSLRSKVLCQFDMNGDVVFQREHQYQIDQLKLDLTARILKPSLDIDYPESEEHNEIGFNMAYSDLITSLNICDRTQLNLQAEKSIKSSVVLTNNKDTAIDLYLHTNLPFELTGKIAKMKQPIQLGIGESMKVEVKFTATRNLVNYLNNSSLIKDDDTHPMRLLQSLMTHDDTRKCLSLQFRDVIKVSYPGQSDNQLDQLIPLRACVNFPEFLSNKTEVQFDWCMVGEMREETVRLVNRSGALTVLSLELKCETKDIFHLNTTFVKVPNRPFITEDNQESILVQFTPKQAKSYSGILRISGCMGEQAMEIELRGVGSYDNQYKPNP